MSQSPSDIIRSFKDQTVPLQEHAANAIKFFSMRDNLKKYNFNGDDRTLVISIISKSISANLISHPEALETMMRASATFRNPMDKLSHFEASHVVSSQLERCVYRTIDTGDYPIRNCDIIHLQANPVTLSKDIRGAVMFLKTTKHPLFDLVPFEKGKCVMFGHYVSRLINSDLGSFTSERGKPDFEIDVAATIDKALLLVNAALQCQWDVTPSDTHVMLGTYTHSSCIKLTSHHGYFPINVFIVSSDMDEFVKSHGLGLDQVYFDGENMIGSIDFIIAVTWRVVWNVDPFKGLLSYFDNKIGEIELSALKRRYDARYRPYVNVFVIETNKYNVPDNSDALEKYNESRCITDRMELFANILFRELIPKDDKGNKWFDELFQNVYKFNDRLGELAKSTANPNKRLKPNEEKQTNK